MIYCNGDNNLAGSLPSDLCGMEAAGSGPGFNIVAETDFDASQTEDLVELGLPEKLATGTSRFLIQSNRDPDKVTTRPVARLPEFDHDDPKRLEEFIVWAIKTYPAQRYGLVLWDHGGQWEGFGGDEQDGNVEDPGSMDTAGLRRAMAGALAKAGVKQLDFLAFDTCLMGGAEVLADMHGLSDVFIANPEIDYGKGWKYGNALGWLKAHPAAEILEFAKFETETWKTYHITGEDGKDEEEDEADIVLAAHCVYDMRRYPAFEQALVTFARRLSDAMPRHALRIATCRRQVNEYSIGTVDEIDQPMEYVDLGEFARKLAADPSLPKPLSASATELAVRIGDLVAFKVAGLSRKDISGLSIWYPVSGYPLSPSEESGEEETDAENAADDDGNDNTAMAAGTQIGSTDDESDKDRIERYRQIAFSRRVPWIDFLDRMHEKFIAVQEAPSIAKSTNRMPLTASPDHPARWSASIESGESSFRMLSHIVRPDRKKRPLNFTYLDALVEAPLNGPGHYPLNWDGTIPMASADGGRTRVCLGAEALRCGSDLWVSYAELRRHGKRHKKQDVLLLAHMTRGEGRILLALNADPDDLAPTECRINPGDTLRPVYLMERRRGNDPEKWTSRRSKAEIAITVPAEGLAGIRIKPELLPEGLYHVETQVEDVFGYVSEIVVQEIRVSRKD